MGKSTWEDWTVCTIQCTWEEIITTTKISATTTKVLEKGTQEKGNTNRIRIIITGKGYNSHVFSNRTRSFFFNILVCCTCWCYCCCFYRCNQLIANFEHEKSANGNHWMLRFSVCVCVSLYCTHNNVIFYCWLPTKKEKKICVMVHETCANFCLIVQTVNGFFFGLFKKCMYIFVFMWLSIKRKCRILLRNKEKNANTTYNQ